MTVILAILAAIVVLGPLVALHEWGHYIVARLCGVKVLTYSIGFGKKLFSWQSKKTGINYAISAIPLGGYVKMLDEREGEVAPEERHLAFNNQPPLKKIAIVVAGPLMNFIIAIFLFWILFVTPSEQFNTRIGMVFPDTPASVAQLQKGDKIVAVDGHVVGSWEAVTYRLADRMGETGTVNVTVEPYQAKQTQADVANQATNHKDNQDNVAPQKTYQVRVNDFMQGEAHGQDALSSLGITPWRPKIEPIIAELSPDGVAVHQGMQIGDKILSINGQAVSDWSMLMYLVQKNPEKPLTFEVLRDGNIVNLSITPKGKKDSMGHQYGQIGAGVAPIETIDVPDEYKTLIVYDPLTALGKSLAKTQQLTVMTLTSMGKMISGMIGIDNLSGPITIAKIAKQSFEISWEMVLSTAAFISLSLGVLNLLPIPVLDGGHLLYYTIELIRGKPLSERVQTIGFNIGFILLAGFMILAIGNDISRLF